MPVNIQLAVQGGGAKICLLLAVFEAIQNLEGKDIHVTRIAGTSAGAIAACLFAAGVPMTDIRARLRESHGKELAALFKLPSGTGWFAKLRAKKQWFDMLRALASGKPLWDTRVLEKKLRELFEKAGKARLGELEPPVRVVATDLGNSASKTYKDDDMIIDALMASSGLPYCFRTWDAHGAPHHIDGGLCENLPVGDLKDGINNDPIVAISFKEKRPGSPCDLVQFSKALFDTAISNSMARARRQLDTSAIFEIEIEKPIGTFDFEEALETGLGDAYNSVRDQARDFFRAFASKQEGDAATRYDPWGETHPAMRRVLRDVGRVYDAQHQPSHFHYLHSSFEITANCLASVSNGREPKPDVVRMRYRFKPSSDPIYCIKFQIHEPVDSKHPFLGVTRWQLKDANGNEMPVPLALPMIDPVSLEPLRPENSAADPSSQIAREVVLFFVPPLPPDSGPYELFCVDEAFEMMGPLARGEIDELAYWPMRAQGNVKHVELILHAPKQYLLKLMPHPEAADPGRRMERNELLEWITHAPPEFLTYGWTGENVRPPLFGFKVSR